MLSKLQTCATSNLFPLPRTSVGTCISDHLRHARSGQTLPKNRLTAADIANPSTYRQLDELQQHHSRQPLQTPAVHHPSSLLLPRCAANHDDAVNAAAPMATIKDRCIATPAFQRFQQGIYAKVSNLYICPVATHSLSKLKRAAAAAAAYSPRANHWPTVSAVHYIPHQAFCYHLIC